MLLQTFNPDSLQARGLMLLGYMGFSLAIVIGIAIFEVYRDRRRISREQEEEEREDSEEEESLLRASHEAISVFISKDTVEMGWAFVQTCWAWLVAVGTIHFVTDLLESWQSLDEV